MVTTIAAEPDEKTSQATSRPAARGTRRVRAAADEETTSGARFFLPKLGGNGSSPELGREMANEGEARVEALKLGVTYYSVQEWRAVADFGGRNPELKREAVTRKGAA